MNIYSKNLLMFSSSEWELAKQNTNLGERSWRGVTYDQYHKYFVAIGETGYTAISEKGDTWDRNPYSSTAPGSYNWSGIAYNGLYTTVAIGGGSSGYITYSANPEVSWNTGQNIQVLNQSSNSSRWHITQGKYNGADALIAVNPFGHIAYCTNLNNPTVWAINTATALGEGSWSSITYGNNQLVAISQQGHISTSQDGINWTTPVQISELLYRSYCLWRAIRYTGKKYVAISYDGYYSESSNGTNWKTAVQNTYLGANNWADMAVGNGYIVAIGYDGYISRKRI